MATNNNNSDFDLSDVFTVVHGEKTVFVHRYVLTKSSDFFKACCKSDWNEGREKKVNLPAEDYPQLEVYLKWLYTGKLEPLTGYTLDDVRGCRLDPCDEQERALVAQNMYEEVLVELAVLGDRLGDADFSNTVADWFIQLGEYAHIHCSPAGLKKLWETLPSNSLIRRLHVDVRHAHGRILDQNGKGSEAWPSAFVFDLMISFQDARRRLKPEPMPTWENRCDYHVHPPPADEFFVCT